MPARQVNAVRLRAALDEQLAALGEPAYTGASDPVSLGRACAAAVARALRAGAQPCPAALRAATSALLDALAARAPGRAVEVRVPPYAAVQCGEGPRHTRGTPGNVVETDPQTWVRLATGMLAWPDALASGLVHASGVRADLSPWLPLISA
ncbi:MAG TPA: sterol carrier family protein [Streptosporangiaceae bacterium]|nr:sterol carrier family protein [Streptosporangiaceae bacterium]